MTATDPLRGFAAALLADVGAEVRDDGTFLWLALPEGLQTELELSGRACVTFDPERIGEFDAELVAPGSYLLERLLALAMRRGRWDLARLCPPPEDWVERAVRAAQGPAEARAVEVKETKEEAVAFFAFRTALTSDEKREAFRLVAAPVDGHEAWEAPWPLPEDHLSPAGLPGYAPDLRPAYARAQAVLLDGMRADMDAFRKAALAALEEEVRRIFRYFDGTVSEVREASPSGAEEVVRAIEAERDRRLAEAVERLEPHAAASLCSVRVVLTPTARASVHLEGRGPVEVRVDALTGHIRGLPPPVTEAGPVPLPARPPSGTPRPRTRAAPGKARSPRGSTGRSRSAASRHPAP